MVQLYSQTNVIKEEYVEREIFLSIFLCYFSLSNIYAQVNLIVALNDKMLNFEDLLVT